MFSDTLIHKVLLPFGKAVNYEPYLAHQLIEGNQQLSQTEGCSEIQSLKVRK